MVQAFAGFNQISVNLTGPLRYRWIEGMDVFFFRLFSLTSHQYSVPGLKQPIREKVTLVRVLTRAAPCERYPIFWFDATRFYRTCVIEMVQ